MDELPRQNVAASFGFSFIPSAQNMGTSQANGLFVPSVGLDYSLRVARRWGLGLQANYELVHYMIVDSQVERDHAFQLALVGRYHVARNWTLFAGGGVELEPHQHLGLLRLGTEYSIGLGEHWELTPEFYFDFKENYDTWSLELGIGRKF